jgi:hypothetical protein
MEGTNASAVRWQWHVVGFLVGEAILDYTSVVRCSQPSSDPASRLPLIRMPQSLVSNLSSVDLHFSATNKSMFLVAAQTHFLTPAQMPS